GCNASKLYRPALFEVTLKLTLVLSFVAVTVAFGTTAPVVSCTVPTMRPVAVWAKPANDVKQQSSMITTAIEILFRVIVSPGSFPESCVACGDCFNVGFQCEKSGGSLRRYNR